MIVRSVAKDFEGIPISLPIIDSQRQIADFLDGQVTRLDRAIATRDRQVALVNERSQAELARLYDWTAKGASRTRLQDLLAQPPCYGVLVPELVDEGVPFIRINDLFRVDAGSPPLASIPARQSLEYRRTIVAPGDVLTAVVGTLGRSAIVQDGQAGANIARAVCRLQPKSNVDPWFIRAWLDTPQFRQAAELATGSGTAQATLNMGDLAKFPILSPYNGTSRVASEAREVLAETAAKVRLMQESADLLAERKQALITAAVTGQFDVSTARGAA